MRCDIGDEFRRLHRLCKSYALAALAPEKRAEEESFVLEDRAADGAAEVVAKITRDLGLKFGAGSEGGTSVEL